MKQALLYIALLFSLAIKADIRISYEQDRELAGAPIFEHGVGYGGDVLYEGEMIPWLVLSDVYVYPTLRFKNKKQAKKYYDIAWNVKRVYPLAVKIQREVEQQIAKIEKIEDKKQRNEYLKVMEKELKKKYYPELRKLSFAQGKLLIKLIDRQCDMTSYALIKTYVGSFKAFYYNAFASLFGASLKKEYDADGEDEYTERCIRLIESGQM